MRHKKHMLVLIMLLLSIVVLSSCKPTSNTSLIYDSNGIKVSTVVVQSPKKLVDYQWVPLTENDVYTSNNLIASGIVSNIREVVIEYRFMDADVKDYVTLFDFTITKELYSSDEYPLPMDKIITVGVPYSSYNYGDWLPVIEEGKEFMLFAFKTSGYKDDILHMDEYVEYWTSAPNSLLIEKVGSHYITDKFFSHYTVSTQSFDKCLGISENQFSYMMNNIDEVNNILDEVNNKKISNDKFSIKKEELINSINIIQSKGISKNIEDSFEILKVLFERSGMNSNRLWMEMSDIYIVRCDDFENAIKEKMESFAGR